jgi:hypothetical protein
MNRTSLDGFPDERPVGGAAPPRLTLRPHACFPPAWTGGVSATAMVPGGRDLALHFRLSADTERLRLPAFRAVQRGHRLWEHTCFEAFLAVQTGPGYVELNFAPSGEWAAYRFTGYRDGMSPIEELEPAIAVSHSAGGLDLALRVGLDRALALGVKVELGLSAVIEDAAGGLSYWALRHPGDRPDFHHAESFALEIPLAEANGFPQRQQ